MRYIEPVFRPPSEAQSLILQAWVVDIGGSSASNAIATVLP